MSSLYSFGLSKTTFHSVEHLNSRRAFINSIALITFEELSSGVDGVGGNCTLDSGEIDRDEISSSDRTTARWVNDMTETLRR